MNHIDRGKDLFVAKTHCTEEKLDKSDSIHSVKTQKLTVIRNARADTIDSTPFPDNHEHTTNDSFHPESKPKKLTTMKKRINESISSETDELPVVELKHYVKVVKGDKTLEDLLRQYLVGVQKQSQQFYEKNPEKAKQRKRIVCGLHECIRFVKYNKAHMVCFAEDIVDVQAEGGTTCLVDTINQYCESNKIPAFQCFTKRKLARIFKRGQSMSVMCVTKQSSAITKEWKALLEYLKSKE